ncbi:sigma D regulator [Shewanella sp. NFH-SH190041]|uniref:sigma D regulator n=1 Tax=Shewanella sp. NFH-SH190041 TaxID=2950245 RepID=UPI0021C45CE7|nr:sigma D regulator [Shewanella sp. NFH-SH190041]BDM65888.1 sigma D regulator [Shewanella sp. NFH-SH190041]
MLTKLERTEQKWGGANRLIDQWLDHRRKLLVQYCKIAGLPPYDQDKGTLPEVIQVKQFCDLLVDYVSEGHFEVYDQVVSACEVHSQSSKELAQKLVPHISQTTDGALDFNDKYAENQAEELLYDLDRDLGVLMHGMETRFQLEDEMLEVLFVNYADSITEPS